VTATATKDAHHQQHDRTPEAEFSTSPRRHARDVGDNVRADVGDVTELAASIKTTG
jgi:hypothetical protein